MSAEKNFMSNLRRVRKAQGRTAVWVAQQCGWSKSQQTKFEQGVRRLWLDDAMLICSVLNVPFDLMIYSLSDEQVSALALPHKPVGRRTHVG